MAGRIVPFPPVGVGAPPGRPARRALRAIPVLASGAAGTWAQTVVTLSGDRPIPARPGLVDDDVPAAHVRVVQFFDGFLGLAVHIHLHEAEASGSTGVPVHDNLC